MGQREYIIDSHAKLHVHNVIGSHNTSENKNSKMSLLCMHAQMKNNKTGIDQTNMTEQYCYAKISTCNGFLGMGK